MDVLVAGRAAEIPGFAGSGARAVDRIVRAPESDVAGRLANGPSIRVGVGSLRPPLRPGVEGLQRCSEVAA